MTMFDLECKLFELEEEVKDLEMILKINIDLLKENKGLMLFQIGYMASLYSIIALTSIFL